MHRATSFLRQGVQRPLTGVRRPSCCRTRPRSVSRVLSGGVPLVRSAVLSEVRAGYPGGPLSRAQHFDSGRREARQALFIERPASRDTWLSMGCHVTVRHLYTVRPGRERLAVPAGSGPADGPRPGREARGRSRWTVGGVDVRGCTDHTERDDRPLPLGKREAVGLSASGLLPPDEVRHHRTSRKVEVKSGRERPMSCRRGHGPRHRHAPPYPPPHDHSPAPRPYAPPPDPPRPLAPRTRRNQGLPATAPERDRQASAGRGRAEAPVRQAGAVTVARGGGVPRRSGRATTAATDP